MSNFKKLMMTAAGADPGLNVEEVFSTYLYEGNGSSQTITNGIDLDGEGGLVWIKPREDIDDHQLYDTARGLTGNTAYDINTNNNSAQTYNSTYGLNDFLANGFGITGNANQINASGHDYASWTFRKAPKFFDVVTYTGTGSNQTISHNLGCEVGAIFVKRTDSTANWAVQHRSTTNTDGLLYLNLTNAEANGFGTVWNGRATSTDFTVGTSTAANTSGATYVAYLFAHNDGDGGFGPNGDQDIIKCGSYTGNGSSTGPQINLGFEPQWLLLKNTSTSGHFWHIYDAMRGWVDGGAEATLLANTPDSENGLTGAANYSAPTATGFKIESTSGEVNTNGNNYIYIAIRRGPMAVPESATDVFATDFLGATSPNPPAYNSGGWPVDMGIQASLTGGGANVVSRLTSGKLLRTYNTDSEFSSPQFSFDFQDGFRDSTAVSNDILGYMWKRAPNFFDVVAYTGTGTEPSNKAHNLGAVPEMIWIKRRNSISDWNVYHKDLGNTHVLRLNLTNASQDIDYFADTTPTETQFTTSNSGDVNASGSTYIAYLFASLAGVSKVGSYTGNGNASQNIDCGFSSGARFVLIKTTNIGSWFFFDTERGIVAGNDSRLELNATSAEVTNADVIDPYSSGFAVTNNSIGLNISGREYIFYAIA